jgi:hypothetical protein
MLPTSKAAINYELNSYGTILAESSFICLHPISVFRMPVCMCVCVCVCVCVFAQHEATGCRCLLATSAAYRRVVY